MNLKGLHPDLNRKIVVAGRRRMHLYAAQALGVPAKTIVDIDTALRQERPATHGERRAVEQRASQGCR